MAFDYLRPKPKTRITTAWGNQLVDALNLLYGIGRRSVKYEDLSRLGYDIIPAEDAKYSLGSELYGWLNVYAHYGYFEDDLRLQGKRVLKDGDPISLYDIQEPAYEKLETLERDLREGIDRLYGKIAPITIDEYGRVGVVIYELAQPALERLLYGTWKVDAREVEESATGEIDTGTETSPVQVLAPPAGARIDARSVYLATDSTAGEVWAYFRDSGKLLAKVYASRFASGPVEVARIVGGVDEPIMVAWSGLDAGAKIFWAIRYKVV